MSILGTGNFGRVPDAPEPLSDKEIENLTDELAKSAEEALADNGWEGLLANCNVIDGKVYYGGSYGLDCPIDIELGELFGKEGIIRDLGDKDMSNITKAYILGDEDMQKKTLAYLKNDGWDGIAEDLENGRVDYLLEDNDKKVVEKNRPSIAGMFHSFADKFEKLAIAIETFEINKELDRQRKAEERAEKGTLKERVAKVVDKTFDKIDDAVDAIEKTLQETLKENLINPVIRLGEAYVEKSVEKRYGIILNIDEYMTLDKDELKDAQGKLKLLAHTYGYGTIEQIQLCVDELSKYGIVKDCTVEGITVNAPAQTMDKTDVDMNKNHKQKGMEL